MRKWTLFGGLSSVVMARRYRLCCKDGQADMLDTFAVTASRCGQRAVNILAATKRWLIWSIDISQAFLKGLICEEVSRMTGTPFISVQLVLPKGAAAILHNSPCLQQVQSFYSFLEHDSTRLRPEGRAVSLALSHRRGRAQSGPH